VGFVVGGVGVAGIAAGAGTGIVALMKHGELTDPTGACHATATCASVANTGKALSWASTSAFAVGAVGVGVGIYLVVSGSTRPQPATAALAIVPRPGGPTIGLTTAF
jgi:hypothetical protein